MTSIDFYFNASDKLQVACRLAAKAASQKKHLLIIAADVQAARKLDRMLWTWQQLSFVPHCLVDDPLAAESPVLIAADAACISTFDRPQVLLNLDGECPPLFERFDRVLELVGETEEDRMQGRARYKFYKERGYAINNHDLSKSGAKADERH